MVGVQVDLVGGHQYPPGSFLDPDLNRNATNYRDNHKHRYAVEIILHSLVYAVEIILHFIDIKY